MSPKLALIPALALAACAPLPEPLPTPSGAVALTAEPLSVRSGQTVTLVLRNGTSGQVGYNLCSSALESGSGGEWRQVPTGRVCTRELRILEPGREVRYHLQLPPGLAAGPYRFTTNVELAGTSSGRVSSNAIAVVP